MTRGHAIGRKIRAPGEELVTRYLTWPQNLEDKIRETAKRRGVPVTDLVREYVAAGIEKDANDAKTAPPSKEKEP